jgi:uncharacterized repeat protein (TIGR01451 family)
MKKILFTLLAVTLLLGLIFPMPVMAKAKWDLEGWRVDSGKWMDGLLFTYYEDDWVPYRLEVTGYDGVDMTIAIQHDYLDADGHVGIDDAGNFFIGPQTARTEPGPSPTAYVPGTVFDVTQSPPIEVPNGYEHEWVITITEPTTLEGLYGGDWAIYWEAHLSLTGSPGVEFGSSFWNGASLHAHTSVTGRQDVPIKTPPQDLDDPSIDVEKYVGTRVCDDPIIWDDADDPTGPIVTEGDDVWFRFVVTNTGNVILSNVTLTDDVFGGISVPGTLAPGESFEGFIGPFNAILGQHTDRATVTGNYGSSTYQDTDDANYFGEPCQ